MGFVRTSVTAILVALFALQSAALGAQSLAEVARKEAERRKAIKEPAKVFTNNDLKSVRRPETGPPAQPAEAATPGEPSSTQVPAQPAQAAAHQSPETKSAGSPPPEEKKDERYWRERMANARAAVERTKVLLDAVQSRINALTTDFVNRDDPYQRAQIAADRDRALAELERLKKELDEQTKAIAQIDEEARKAGVPPGWLR